VELFVERARAVLPGFDVGQDGAAEAVEEICRRLDGIALAIELAAARMVSMSAQDVRDRLGDRFRLLSGSRRALERHQTLRHAVQWSFDLLDAEERLMLGRCSVFAVGFDLAAATEICGDGAGSDVYAVLDLLDSLVRKSLVTSDQAAGHARYGTLETVRQFAEEQLAATGTSDQVRDRHATYYADRAVAHWELWDGPRQPVALHWVDDEFANLRTAFRWATDRGNLAAASAIASSTALLSWARQRFEPVGWAEEILAAATAAQLRQLPRLFTAASLCSFTGRADVARGYAQAAMRLEADARYDGFEGGWSRSLEATAHRYAGRSDRWLDICADLAVTAGYARVFGLCGLTFMLAEVKRGEEARAIADETLSTARRHGNPMFIAYAMWAYGRAYMETDPARAMDSLREGLDYAQVHRVAIMEANIARHAAAVEAVHGELDRALELFDAAIDSLHRSGNHGDLVPTLAYLAVFFDRIERPEVAATVYGASTRHSALHRAPHRRALLDHLRAVLGETAFDHCVTAGAAMEPGDAVRYARSHIQLARHQLNNRQ
jgi:hypothetical protein